MSAATVRSVDPSTGKVLRESPLAELSTARSKLARAHEVQRTWRALPFGQRAELLQTAAKLFRARREELALLMAEEMGKPVREGRGEIDKCALVAEFYASRGPEALADRIVQTDAHKSYVAYRPLGIVLAIMPWNFPFWQVMRFAAPALMAGNGALLKHAPNVRGAAEAIEALLVDAGFPEGLFSNVFLSDADTGALIDEPGLAAVTLTGSTEAGRSVAARAGAQIKKTVLELGGSDPYLVLEDADLEAALDACATSRLINGGQSCISAKRFIVMDPLHDAFVAGLVQRLAAVRQGDPRMEETDLGPLAREDLRDNLHRQVVESVERGASVALGGELPEGPGFFYPPTVLTGVESGMPAHDEELFGPVAAVLRVTDEAQAIRVANDTSFGLAAAVFTNDAARGERIARDELQAGACFVNTFARSDPRLPFGGIRNSGYGRELSIEGIREFVNVKTIYVA